MDTGTDDLVYDVVIIGAGPAGIQAAIHAVRKKAGSCCWDGLNGVRSILPMWKIMLAWKV